MQEIDDRMILSASSVADSVNVSSVLRPGRRYQALSIL